MPVTLYVRYIACPLHSVDDLECLCLTRSPLLHLTRALTVIIDQTDSLPTEDDTDHDNYVQIMDVNSNTIIGADSPTCIHTLTRPCRSSSMF